MKNKTLNKILNIAKPAFAIGFISGAVRLYSVIAKYLTKKSRHERIQKRITVALCTCAALSALAGVLTTLFLIVKKRRGGYFFDIFDRDTYNAVDDEDEEEIKNKVKSELECDGEICTSKRNSREVPYDIDATADNLG